MNKYPQKNEKMGKNKAEKLQICVKYTERFTMPRPCFLIFCFFVKENACKNEKSVI